MQNNARFIGTSEVRMPPPEHPAYHEARAWARHFEKHGIVYGSNENEECTGHYIALMCDQTGETITVYIPCPDRACPRCSPFMDGRRKRTVERRVREMDDTCHPNSFLRFMTLTMRPMETDEATLQYIHEAFVRFRRHREIKKRIFRGVWCIEFTHFPDRQMHIHIHLLYEGRYIPQGWISDHWWQATDGHGYVTDIRPVRGTKENIAEYMSKYLTKNGWVHPLWKYHSWLLQGKQLMGVLGKFTPHVPDERTWTFLGNQLNRIEDRYPDIGLVEYTYSRKPFGMWLREMIEHAECYQVIRAEFKAMMKMKGA
jgi:hypothetical protein